MTLAATGLVKIDPLVCAECGAYQPVYGTTRLYTGALGEPCAAAPRATQTFAVAQLISPILRKDCPSWFGASWGTENVTFDQVAPRSVVPRNIEEPPSVVFPICWETDSDPDAQHSFGLGHDKPVKVGPGTSAGIGSSAQLSPPFVVDARFGAKVGAPDVPIAPITEQSSASAHDSCVGKSNPVGKAPADHRAPSSVVNAAIPGSPVDPEAPLVPTTVHWSPLEHAMDGIYKPRIRRRSVKVAPPSLVESNVESIESLFPSELVVARPRQTCIDGHESAPRVPIPCGSGSIVKVWPPFDVVMKTDRPRYVPPDAQVSALAQEIELVGAKPFGIGSTDQLFPTSSVT